MSEFSVGNGKPTGTALVPAVLAAGGATVATVAGLGVSVAFMPAVIVSLCLSVPVTIYVRKQERLERIALIAAQKALEERRMDHELARARMAADQTVLADYMKLVAFMITTGARFQATYDEGSITVTTFEPITMN